MKYLYLLMEIVLYVATVVLYLSVFSRYRYRPAFENSVETKPKTAHKALIAFLALFFGMVLVVFFVWRRLGHEEPHHIGYFTSFFVSGLLTLAWFRKSLPRIDLTLCLPSIGIVWILLLVFEALLEYFNAGWVYTDSTVLTFKIGGFFTVIFENLIVFYVFAPYMSIVMFTGLAANRSDRVAFIIVNLIIWVGGAVWEYLSIGIFHLWYMVEDRSILPFNLFNARTTIEEMLYYVPFAALSILIYLELYYRKYRYLSKER